MHPQTVQRRLDAIPGLARTGKPVNGLYRLLTSRPLWEAALDRIRTNKGARTPGVDGIKVIDLGNAHIEAVIAQLMEGTYRPTPVRRVYIPKANGKLRPLGIPTALDRLIQEVVRSILDLVYEPIFVSQSHGFRKERSCHTALDSIRHGWNGTKWFVEVDIVGCFDNIDHSVLLNLLRRRISDERFIALIAAMLRAGFLEGWAFNATYSGTPQGGVISPLLANVYLHELDLFVTDYMLHFDKGTERAPNPDYQRAKRRTRLARKAYVWAKEAGRGADATTWHAELKSRRAAQMCLPSRDPMDPNFKRLRYVRYADDFLLGVIGSRNDAAAVMAAIEAFLGDALRLRMSPEKSGIRKASEGVQFLGYGVKTVTSPNAKTQNFGNGHRGTRRAWSDTAQLYVPRDKVTAFAGGHGYGDLATLRARHRSGLIHCDDVEVIWAYNAELRGFANYYALAWDVKAKLGKFAYLWLTSLLKTLAAKHKSTVQAVVDRLRVGPGDFVIERREGDKKLKAWVWKLSSLQRKPAKWDTVDALPSTRYLTHSRTSAVARAFALECSACGTKDGPIHVHHRNPVRTIKVKATYKHQMAERLRDVRPLCKGCHNLLHAGRLPDTRGRVSEMESRVR